MIEPTVVFEVAPSRYVIERKHPDQGWALIGRKSTLEEAKEYAQRAMDYAPPGSTALYRVVDTQPYPVRVGDETPLTMDAYQQQAAKTAVYPEDEAVQYLIAGLAGEVGEVASLFAKYWRGDGDFNRDHVAAELGDVLWFVAMLADDICCNLSDVAQGNLDKLADRANRGKLKGNGDNR